jgi:hypothetical protein
MVEAAPPADKSKETENVSSFQIDGILPSNVDFISTMKKWDDEDFKMDDELRKGIEENNNWTRPSKI